MSTTSNHGRSEKLRLLNGAQSLHAYSGIIRGHTTVASAIRDIGLRALVERFWDEATGTLPSEALDLERYRSQLVQRFENTRIEHRLTQIARDGTTKLGLRVAPIALSERRARRPADASAAIYPAWIQASNTIGGLADSCATELADALRLRGRDAVRQAIALTDNQLADDDEFVQLVYGMTSH